MGGGPRETRKKRTISQDVGERGEDAFKAMIKREGVLATKLEQDYGIDFLGQVFGRPDATGAALFTGVVIGAAVRSTSNRRARIKLTPEDAGELLAANFPVAVVMIDLSATTPQMHFRFVEGEFALKLADFVDGSAGTLSFTARQLLPQASFQAALAAVLRPGHSERLRLLLAERGLTKSVPSARLGVTRGPDGDLTLVELRNVVDQFDLGSAENQKAFLHAVFGAPSLLGQRFAKLPRKESMLSALVGLPSPVLIGGPLHEGEAIVEVRDGSTTASCRFVYRKADKWFGYVHETGFSIRISTAMPHNNAMVHFMEASADPHAALDLTSAVALWKLLEACSANAILCTDGERFLPTAEFGDLMRFGFFARYLRTIVAHSGRAEPWVLHGELTDEHLNSAACAAAMLDQKVNISALGVLVTDKDIKSLDTEQRTIRVPIAMNTPTAAIVVWVRVEADAYREDGYLVGFKPTKLLDVTFEERAARFKKTEWPEVVLTDDYPTFALTGDGRDAGTADASTWGCAMELEEASHSDAAP